MKGDRTTPRTIRQINESLCLVMQRARDDCKCVHLLPCDFKIVSDFPAKFNCVKQRDGSIHAVLRGKLIEVVAVE